MKATDRRARRGRRAPLAMGMAALVAVTVGCVPRDGMHSAVDGFAVTNAFEGLTYPTNVEFAPDGRVFVTEKAGTVVAFDGLGDTTPTVVADLGDDIHNYEDRGLLGLEVDPTFPVRPYLYVLYTLDRDDSWADACPSPPGTFEDGCVADGRLSRLTVDPATNQLVDETVLLEDRWCAQFPSHTVGDLEFAPDGALLVSAGDGADYNSVDYGQRGGSTDSPTLANPCDDPPGGSGTALTPPTARGGALRAQTLTGAGTTHTYDGTLLRVDPDTGAAWSDNPLVGGGDTVDDRVVAHGLRNPYRMATRPGTGEVWVGDVGWGAWEEVNRVVDPADATVENFGWPCYEGAERQSSYDAVGLDACEGLYDGTLTAPSTLTDPYYGYRHGAAPDPENCGTDQGSAVTAVDFYEGGDYPAGYAGALFFGDYARGCLWAMKPDADGMPDPTQIETLVPGTFPVDIEAGPGGDIYWVDILGGTIKRLGWVGEAGPPQARIVATPDNGPVPLDVQLDGSTSNPGAAGSPTYAWDLDGDGAYDDSTAVNPTRTYTAAGDVTVGLQVTNAGGLSDTDQVVIHAGNTRPQPVLSSPVGGTSWEAGRPIDLAASASDAEDGTVASAGFDWQVDLHHCSTPSDCHVHPLQTIEGQSSASIVAPSHEAPAHLELTVTATDSDGLAGSASLRLDPLTVDLQFRSEPEGLTLSVGSRTLTTPFTQTAIVGAHLAVTAPTPQDAGGEWAYTGWSDGGARTHDVTVSEAATYTATYAPVDPEPPPAGTDVQYLSDLPWVERTNGFGPVERDMSNGGGAAGDGAPIRLRGEEFAKGVGGHADGAIAVDVPAGCRSFEALVGIDDEVGANGSVTFTVSGDGAELAATRVIGPSDPAWPIAVDVTGVSRLTLTAGHGDDNNWWDHVDWADARFLCGDEPPPDPGGFGPPVSLPTGDQTHSVLARDLDADGDLDLVAAAAGSDDAAVVLLRTGSGYAPAATYPTGTGTSPKHVEVGDLTGDGIVDLVSANQDSTTNQDVTVLPGLGDGTFGPGATYAACERPHQTALGDLDGDTDLDVMVACWGGNVVSVLRNDGTGVLGPQTDIVTGDSPHSLVLRDFDADGDLDAAVAALGDNRLAIIRNAGDGTFGAPGLLWPGLGPHNVTAGDVDADGDDDLVTTAQNGNVVGVLRSNGDGTFADAAFYDVGPTPKASALGDVDGDGDLDIVTANTHGNYPSGTTPTTLSVLLGNGDGTFSAGYTLANDLTPFSVTVADLDGNGDADIATANWHTDDVKVRYHP